MHQITIGSTQLFKKFKALFRAVAWENACKMHSHTGPSLAPCWVHLCWESGFWRRFHCSL